ncbi:MAG: polyphosphate polymerase domain-containing protein [Patescibacteria group bacterium]
MHRFEFKYQLDPVQTLEARSFLNRIMQRDSYAPQGWYSVISVYFDSIGLRDYYEKCGGFLNRKKIRLRTYEGAGRYWLEMKAKHDMGFRKVRAEIIEQDWHDCIDHNLTRILSRIRPAQDQLALEELLGIIIGEARRPSAFIRYRRTPLVFGTLSDPIRMTFDEQIEASFDIGLDTPQSITSILPHGSILEVKFAKTLPSWFGTLVRQLHLTRTSFSKYANAIDALHRYKPLPK